MSDDDEAPAPVRTTIPRDIPTRLAAVPITGWHQRCPVCRRPWLAEADATGEGIFFLVLCCVHLDHLVIAADGSAEFILVHDVQGSFNPFRANRPK